MERPPARVGAKLLLGNGKGEFLFLLRSHIFEGEAKPVWDIPGGRVKPDESLLAAVRRETDEETGLKPDEIDPWPLAVQHIRRIGVHVVRYTFQGKTAGTPLVTLGDEHKDLAWATLEQGARLHVDPYLREVLAVERSRQQ